MTSLQSLEWDKLPPVGLLTGLTTDELAELDGHGKTIHVAAGETIIQEGEPQNCLYVVLSGKVRISRLKDGTPEILNEAGEGDVFGEMAVIDPDRASATVEVSTEAELWVIARDDFYRLVGDNKEMGVKMLFELAASLVQRVRSMNSAPDPDGPEGANVTPFPS